jgi:hypothetical protein
MVNKTPTCHVETTGANAGDMVIHVTDEDLTSTDWTTFIMKFDIGITNPGNKLGSTTIDSCLV